MLLGDADDFALRQVHQRRDDVLHIGLLVQQRADDAGGQVVGRLRQVIGDHLDRLVAAQAVPEQIERGRPTQQEENAQCAKYQCEDRRPTRAHLRGRLPFGRFGIGPGLPGRPLSGHHIGRKLHPHFECSAGRQAVVDLERDRALVFQK